MYIFVIKKLMAKYAVEIDSDDLHTIRKEKKKKDCDCNFGA